MDNQHHHQQEQQQPYFYGRRPALRRQISSSSSCAETLPTASVTSSLSSLDEQEVASSLASSPLPMAATFRSMKITRQYQGAPPLLAPPAAHQQAPNTKTVPVGTIGTATSAETAPITASETVDPASIVGTVPVLSPIHILERTAIQIPFATTKLETILQRIFDYLRHHSMTYQCDKDTGCLDCMSMEQGVVVGFVVQLWRRPSNHAVTLEVQRRQGCSIEMNSIRRSLIQYVLHGGESQLQSSSQQNQTKMPSSWMQVDPTAFHKNASTTTGCRRRSFAGIDWNECSHFGSNKRPKTPAFAVAASPNGTAMATTAGSTPSSAPTTATTSSIDNALAITVRLLESSRRDEQQLGFESLTIMTNPHCGVQYNDAMAVSRAFIKGEGTLGSRLQQRVASLLQQVKPPSINRHNKAHGIMFDSATASQDYQPGSMSAILYNLALQALVNGLDQVTAQHNANSKNSAGLDAKSSQPGVLIDLNSMFWQTVIQCLLSSLEDATSRPHEAALSAKCIRFLLSAGPGAPSLPVSPAFQHQNQPQPLMCPQPAAATHSQQQLYHQFQHFDGSTMQTVLRRAHAFGKTHHLFLEQESQRLMGKCNNRSWAHAA